MEVTLVDGGRILGQCVCRGSAPPVAASRTEMASQGITMIAQVFTAKVPSGGISDEMRKFTEDALSEARRRDGVEGVSPHGRPSYWGDTDHRPIS